MPAPLYLRENYLLYFCSKFRAFSFFPIKNSIPTFYDLFGRAPVVASLKTSCAVAVVIIFKIVWQNSFFCDFSHSFMEEKDANKSKNSGAPRGEAPKGTPRRLLHLVFLGFSSLFFFLKNS